MNYSEKIKNVLLNKIQEMADYSWLFACNPDKDFTRKRKLDFETTIRLMLSMESGNLNNELLKFFQYSANRPTVSAFNQQRAKLLPEALAFLFHEFNEAFPESKTYRGYRLLACNGSDLNIPRNPVDTAFECPVRFVQQKIC